MVSDNSLAERPSPSTNLAEVDFITALVERPTHDEGVMPQRRLKEGLYRDPQYRKTYVPESSTQDHKAAPEEASLNHEDRHLLLENSDRVRADKRKVAATTPQTLGHLSEEEVWVA